jgi:hypothetical protein
MPVVHAGFYVPPKHSYSDGRPLLQAEGSALLEGAVDEVPGEEDDLADLGLGVSDDDVPAADDAQVPANDGAEEEKVVDGYEEEDENASVQADEAEEEERPIWKATDAQEQQAMREEVRALVGRMEQAVAKDEDDLCLGKPATRKLQMLQQVRSWPSRLQISWPPLSRPLAVTPDLHGTHDCFC